MGKHTRAKARRPSEARGVSASLGHPLCRWGVGSDLQVEGLEKGPVWNRSEAPEHQAQEAPEAPLLPSWLVSVGAQEDRAAVGGSGQRAVWSGLLLSPVQREALSEYRPILCDTHQLQRRSSSVADKKLVLIPLIFICLRIWSTVRFVLTLCGSPAVRIPVLVVLHVGLPSPPGCPSVAWPDPLSHRRVPVSQF